MRLYKLANDFIHTHARAREATMITCGKIDQL